MYENIPKNIKLSLLLLATMGVMSGIAIVASLPLIALKFQNIPNIEFYSKLLLTIPSIVIALSSPFVGMIADKFGRLKPLYFGFILFVIGGSSGYFLANFYIILIGRGVLGLGVAFIMTSSLALVGDIFDEKGRHKFMSMQGMFVGLGGVIFIISGGYLANVSWHLPFLIYLLPLLFLPLLLVSLKEPKILHTKPQENLEVGSKLLPVYLTGFFSMLLFYMLPTQMPYLIINKLGGTPALVSYFIALAMLINAIIAKQYHRLKARFSFFEIFVIIYMFFGIGLLIISQVTKVEHIFFASFFMGVGFGLVLVNTNVWLLSLVEAHKRAKAVGILTSSFFFGQFFSPIVFEPIVLKVGIQGLFFTISIVSIFVAIGFLVVSKRAKRHLI